MFEPTVPLKWNQLTKTILKARINALSPFLLWPNDVAKWSADGYPNRLVRPTRSGGFHLQCPPTASNLSSGWTRVSISRVPSFQNRFKTLLALGHIYIGLDNYMDAMVAAAGLFLCSKASLAITSNICVL